MDEDNKDVIEMGLPCLCPRCGDAIMVKINLPYPLVDILTPDELPDDIKDAIINSQNDTPQEPEAA